MAASVSVHGGLRFKTCDRFHSTNYDRSITDGDDVSARSRDCEATQKSRRVGDSVTALTTALVQQ